MQCLIAPLCNPFAPASEDPSSGLTPCEERQRQAQAQHAAYPGSLPHVPQCDERGGFLPLQCHGTTGFCWCVDPDGRQVPGTRTPPGSTPLRCGLPGEPGRDGSRARLGLGLGEPSGADRGGGLEGSVHLWAHSCGRDGRTDVGSPLRVGLRPHTGPGQAWTWTWSVWVRPRPLPCVRHGRFGRPASERILPDRPFLRKEDWLPIFLPPFPLPSEPPGTACRPCWDRQEGQVGHVGGPASLLPANYPADCRQAWHVDAGPSAPPPPRPAAQKRGGNRRWPVRRAMLLVSSA